MRTLNRPMFRYGGPIKEGVMKGIREPKKNGGSMSPQFNTGLVGDERYPKTDGREKHGFFIPPMLYAAGAAGLRMLAPRAIAAGTKAFGRGLATSPGAGTSVFGKGLTKMQRLKNLLPSSRFRQPATPSGQVISGKYTPAPLSIKESLRSPEIIGRAIRENPFTSFGVAGQVKNAPDIAGGIFDVGKSAIQGGTNYLLGTEFGKGDKKEELSTLQKLTTDTIKEVLTPKEQKALAESKKATAEAAKIAAASFAKAEKEKRIESYREIMDIKGMNKDAAYKSLVDASKIIQEGGNLKKQLKSGKLISNLTQAASKRFDKVNQTEDAINSLILKGEIEKNINDGKEGSQMKAAKDFAETQGITVTQAYKDLGFSKNKNLSENIAIVSKSQGGIGLSTDSVTEGIRMTYPELGIPQVVFTDAELIDQKKKNPLYKNANEAEIFEDFAVKNELGNGVYVLGTTAFTLTDGKLVQLR